MELCSFLCGSSSWRADARGGLPAASQIIDADPAQVKIGMQVEAAFRKLGEEGESGIIHYGYKFRPTS